jgi:hypothetical protein
MGQIIHRLSTEVGNSDSTGCWVRDEIAASGCEFSNRINRVFAEHTYCVPRRPSFQPAEFDGLVVLPLDRVVIKSVPVQLPSLTSRGSLAD